jgi:uncharacterized membrane protein
MSVEIEQDDNSVEMTTETTHLELTSEPNLDAVRESSNNYSTEKTLRWMQNSSAQVLAPLNDAANVVFKQNRGLLVLLGWAALTLISFKVLFALIDAINDIPLIPLILELVGISYIAWFVYRYLLKANTRQELIQQINQFKQEVVGNKATNSATSIDVKKSVVINKSPEELYQFWRNFENLPRFMNHLESVTVVDDKRSHWVAKAPFGTHVEWDAEIIDEAENKTIVWRSLEGSDVDSVGSVAFASANGSGTQVKVTMAYNPPGGDLGAAAAQLFGENPQQQLDEDLDRFKQLMETGAVFSAS